ncbi:hypothetical protein DFJ58DRAFT_768950, partial [Suillus subalutaceus]|uniref:uncharacterized protein n=1 Tax=Suillus subalutaceus TaxID=48586 RepID=UPI001B8767A0
ILIIRTYALYGGSKRLLTLMTIIMITLAITVSVEGLGRYMGPAALLPGVGCYETYTVAMYAILFALLQSRPSVNPKSNLHATTLSNCRSWASMDGRNGIRITNLHPHSVQDL